jgi:hypothetical protein
MKLNRLRSFLYGSARTLGDVQALEQAAKKGSLEPIAKRAERRTTGKVAGRILRAIFK